VQAADPGSILHLYRRLLVLRSSSPALRLGTWHAVDSPEGTLAYQRRSGDDERTIVINYGADAAAVALASGLVVQVSSDGVGEGEPYAGVVGGSAAVVLGPSLA
jgi:alpha-glucosidase